MKAHTDSRMRASCVLLLCIVALLISAPEISRAQGPPCLPTSISPFYLLPYLSEMPSPNASMPIEVQEGYRDAGIEYRKVNQDSLMVLFFDQKTLGDTIGRMMRLYYAMVDHDPFLFAQTTSLPRTSNTNSGLTWLYVSLEAIVRDLSPRSSLDTRLLRASLIVRIRCDAARTDTLLRDGFNPLPITTVQATILDTFKGRRVPVSCAVGVSGVRRDAPLPTRMTLVSHRRDAPDTIVTEPTTIGHCLRFHYSPSWGVTDIEPGREYIVFLHVLKICDDEHGTYIGIRPVGSGTLGMFPIEDDTVLMRGDELGLGSQSMPVAEFTDAIRSRIAEIGRY